jgi:hypothetical protein
LTDDPGESRERRMVSGEDLPVEILRGGDGEGVPGCKMRAFSLAISKFIIIFDIG